MKKKSLLVLAVTIIFLMSMLVNGCGSNDSVDQTEDVLGELSETIQADFSQSGWSYSGYEVLDTDEENDITTIALKYDVNEGIEELLQSNASEKANNEYVYGLAEDVQARVIVELSEIDKESNTAKTNLKSTEYYVGKTEVGEWINQQNAKWKTIGESISFETGNGDLEITIEGASKTNWDDSSEGAYMASIRAIVKNNKYTDCIYDEGVCQYDLLSYNKDIKVYTEDGILCNGGDLTGPTDGAYDPNVKAGEGDTVRMCLEVIVPEDTENVIMKFGDDAYLYLPIDQNTIGY